MKETAEDILTSHEIAVKFAEAFQKNYPFKPLFEMMEDLSKDIEKYADQKAKEIADKAWEAGSKRGYADPQKETFMKELFKE